MLQQNINSGKKAIESILKKDHLCKLQNVNLKLNLGRMNDGDDNAGVVELLFQYVKDNIQMIKYQFEHLYIDLQVNFSTGQCAFECSSSIDNKFLDKQKAMLLEIC